MAYREFILKVIKPIYYPDGGIVFDGANSRLKMGDYNSPAMTPEQFKRTIYALGVFKQDDGNWWFVPGFFVEPEGHDWLSALQNRLSKALARRYW